MIAGFKHRGLKRLYTKGTGHAFPTHHVPILEDILAHLDVAKDIQSMNLPGFELHQLKGHYQGYWSVRVSGNYRVIFEWKDGKAFNVNYLDYH